MGRVSLDLYRTFYTDGGFVESPIGSGYYTLGNTVETPSGSGLYDATSVVESGIAGLYIIPDSGRRKVFTNIENYSIVEDATTIDPSNYNGGAGQVTVQTQDIVASNIREFYTAALTLEDTTLGQVQATVRGMSNSNGSLTLTADSIVGLLNVDKTVQPQTSTLGQALSYYLGLVDLAGSLSVDSSITARPVVYPGWDGNLWDNIKRILLAERIELTLVDGLIVVRPLRTQEIRTDYFTQSGWDMNSQQVANKVRLHYYSNTLINQGEVYPVPPDEIMPQDAEDAPPASEPTVYNVDAGETLVFTVDMKASLTQVNQPQIVDFVENRSYAGTNGVYAVAGNDGKPITAAQWTAQGGRLSVRLLNPNQIEVTIIGAYASEFAPYRIAMTAGTSSYYNSLHITGRGVFFTDRYVDLVTGATANTTGEEIGAEVENPFISTLAQAYTVGQHAAATYATTQTISGNGRRLIDDGSTFGNVAGGRILVDNAYYRVNSATHGPDQTSLNGSLDTLIKDMNQRFNGMTMGEFSKIWVGRPMLDFTMAPLKEA
jgi:hypothetical protein